MEDSSDRQSKTPDGGAPLSAMARASRSASPSAPPPAPENRNSAFSSPFVSDDRRPKNEDLPPPYEDASGFIDLDKLRAAAMAEAAARPPSFSSPTCRPFNCARLDCPCFVRPSLVGKIAPP